jgi:glycerol-3-phosphate dehydrogenase subunit C
MTRNPKEEQYWNESDLRQELDRIWDICHGCRLCFNLCPSFGELFRFIDENDGEAKKLDRVQLDRVTDLCYQCKLCLPKCPYSPPHHWGVDVPRLLLRDKAVRTKKKGLTMQDRLTVDPDRIGKMSCGMASFTNKVNRNPLARAVMEKVLGVHKDRPLPEYHGTTFEGWFRKRKDGLKSERKVAFFYTCFVNYNNPDQGKAAVQVLEKNGFEVIVPRQVCCGMPFLDAGDIKGATRNMEQNLQSFQDVLEKNIPVVTVGPTCTYVLKNEIHYVTQDPRAEALGKATKDLSEFLMDLKSKNQLNLDFAMPHRTRIAYQIPCHLRVQNIGYKSMELLRAIPNVTVELMEHCSAMDGTWGMKKDYFDLSLKIARKLFREVDQSEPDVVCTDCPLSAMQIEFGTKRKAVHPIQIVQRAYMKEATEDAKDHSG